MALETIKDKRVAKLAKELAPVMYPKTARSVGYQFEKLWNALQYEDQFKIFSLGRRVLNICEGREPGEGPLQLLERK